MTNQPNSHRGRPQPGIPGETRTPSGARAPRLELILIAVAVLLPLAIVGWRTVSQRLGSQTVIALEWPENRRPGTTLQLDGVVQEVMPTGPLEYVWLPGEVRIVVTPQAGPPFKRSVLLEAGQTTVVRIPWHEFDLAGCWPGGGPQGGNGGRTSSAANVAGTRGVPASPHTENAVYTGNPEALSVANASAEMPSARPSGNAASATADGGIVFPSSNPNFTRVLGPVAVARRERWAARTRQIQERAAASAKTKQHSPDAVTPAVPKGVAGPAAVPAGDTPPKESRGL
jgi:hypothetical protein